MGKFKTIYHFFKSLSGKANPPRIKSQSYEIAKKNIHFPFDFDRWYPRLEKLTFPSEIIPISLATAEAMVKFYQTTFLKKGHLSPEDCEEIYQLENTILTVMQNQLHGQEVFVRMSNRSPKDGIPLQEMEQSSFAKYQDIISSDADSNQKMMRLTELQMQNLKCQSPTEVLNLLLSSERVYADLQLALKCAEQEEDEWSTSLILRQWIPELRQDQEFRLFVYQNELRAISQYNPYCCYPSLVEQPLAELKESLMNFVEQIKDKVETDTYILDIAITEGEIKIIELNPYDQTTGSCLFCWQQDENLLKGENTEDLPVIRVLKEPLPNLDKWIDLMVDEQKAISSGELMTKPYYEILAQSTPQQTF